MDLSLRSLLHLLDWHGVVVPKIVEQLSLDKSDYPDYRKEGANEAPLVKHNELEVHDLDLGAENNQNLFDEAMEALSRMRTTDKILYDRLKEMLEAGDEVSHRLNWIRFGKGDREQ